MAKDILSVRDVDEEIWRRFRAKTEEEGMKTGQALSEALDVWMKEKEKRKRHPDPRRIMKVEGVVSPGKRVRWSTEVDEALYGISGE